MGQSPEGALRGDGGVIGEGADLADLADGAGFGLGALAVGLVVFEGFTVGAGLGALVVGGGAGGLMGGLVGSVLAVGNTDGPRGGAVTVTVTAGRGWALAGTPEFIAAIPAEQAATPNVPDTVQAIADLDHMSSSRVKAIPPGCADQENRMRILSHLFLGQAEAEQSLVGVCSRY